MSSRIVDDVLRQINSMPGPTAIAVKKLLFLKLEQELNESRCVINIDKTNKKDSDNDVVDLES